MKPNIGRAGRIARATTGSICIGCGVAAWFWGWPESTTWRSVLSAVAVAAGVFQLFEAKRAWCVTRACGIKTPM